MGVQVAALVGDHVLGVAAVLLGGLEAPVALVRGGEEAVHRGAVGAGAVDLGGAGPVGRGSQGLCDAPVAVGQDRLAQCLEGCRAGARRRLAQGEGGGQQQAV
jgi:hypothetical protein